MQAGRGWEGRGWGCCRPPHLCTVGVGLPTARRSCGKERQAGRECVAPQAEENISEKVNQIPRIAFRLA